MINSLVLQQKFFYQESTVVTAGCMCTNLRLVLWNLLQRCMGSLMFFSAISTKGDNYYYFLFALLGYETPPKGSLLFL